MRVVQNLLQDQNQNFSDGNRESQSVSAGRSMSQTDSRIDSESRLPVKLQSLFYTFTQSIKVGTSSALSIVPRLQPFCYALMITVIFVFSFFGQVSVAQTAAESASR